ncbi:TetR/AcrR family transcriptional regulator [Actinoallomurus spadix]|uniref:TetR family transcriptional regulator n=1 Tax=Actinoallomurus spadix TaxID=79912 RepID=A0ABP3G7U1_9ACTN|nr:TetR family transcriptional regulator [Actinoallomurus spadix]MCO5989895.1 TetR/AcrR family transcriptional regulator [Actinoallomurus spadix]
MGEPAATGDGPPTAKRLPRAQRRDQLLAAAERAIARDGPQVSMDTVAAEAGVSKPIVYRHFGDKNGLAHAVGERFAVALLSEWRTTLAAHADPRERTHAAIEVILRRIDEAPQTYRFLTRGSAEGVPALGDALDSFLRLIGDDLAAFMSSVNEDKSPERQAALLTWGHAMVGLVRSSTDLWLDRRHVSREELVAQLTDLLWNGFGDAGWMTGRPPGTRGDDPGTA